MLRAALALAVLLAAAGCSTPSNCQLLGEKLCACSGLTHDACTTQVETELKGVSVNDTQCEAIFNDCNDNKPADVEFCTWMFTEAGKRHCGVSWPVGN